MRTGISLTVSSIDRQRLSALVGWPAIGDALEGLGEPSVRIDLVHLGGLCLPPNYAERMCFP